jgi:hypothetical protein
MPAFCEDGLDYVSAKGFLQAASYKLVSLASARHSLIPKAVNARSELQKTQTPKMI